jgi:hypothetical protein
MATKTNTIDDPKLTPAEVAEFVAALAEDYKRVRRRRVSLREG